MEQLGLNQAGLCVARSAERMCRWLDFIISPRGAKEQRPKEPIGLSGPVRFTIRAMGRASRAMPDILQGALDPGAAPGRIREDAAQVRLNSRATLVYGCASRDWFSNRISAGARGRKSESA
jgi:hypothetical protein